MFGQFVSKGVARNYEKKLAACYRDNLSVSLFDVPGRIAFLVFKFYASILHILVTFSAIIGSFATSGIKSRPSGESIVLSRRP